MENAEKPTGLVKKLADSDPLGCQGICDPKPG
jgi:hypothetical protein